jgi:endogenous inhibitor of DNA gyrase (YacG/DUF329 family)
MSATQHYTVVKCPACGKPVEWRPESLFRPFCSDRCKRVDLGAWANEEYRVPASDSDPGVANSGDTMGTGEAG